MTAIILKQEDWGEHNALVTLYTRERGKMEAVAKGLRKRESKLAAHLEPLMMTEVFLVHGKRHPILAGSSVVNRYQNLRESYQSLLLAGSLAILVDRLVPLENGEEAVFDLLQNTFAILDGDTHTKPHGQLVLPMAAWQLLNMLGYQIDMSGCLVCRLPLSKTVILEALISPRRGGIAHMHCLDVRRSPAIKVTRPILGTLAFMATAPLPEVKRMRGTPEIVSQLALVIQACLEERLESAVLI